MLWRDDAVVLKGMVNAPEEYSQKITPLKKAKVLYIDDFLKVKKGSVPTSADINLAFELINYRYINKDLITLISSEWLAEEIVSIDEAVGSRIYERSKNYCLEFSGAGKNQRLKLN